MTTRKTKAKAETPPVVQDTPPVPETAPPQHTGEDVPNTVGLVANGVGRQPIDCRNTTDEDGNPTGGHAIGVGFIIDWQDGPTRDPETHRKIPQTGAFIEDVAQTVIQRLEFYQGSKFASPFNEAALDHFRRGLVALESRRRDREARGVDGLHEA